MKIAIVFDDSLDRPDGVQQYVGGLGQWLAAHGHQVHYLVGQTASDPYPNIHSLSRNVGVSFNGNRLTIPLPASRRRIRALLAELSLDVVHVMMPYSPLLAGRVIAATPPTTVVFGTFHILPQTALVRQSTRLLGLWLQKTLGRFDQVVAVSPAAQDFAEQAFRCHDVTVRPNFINNSNFAQAKPFQRYDDGVPTVLFLGRLVPRKGCADLLRAVAQLRTSYKGPLRLVICGKGPEMPKLQRLAESAGVADLVEFTGYVSEDDKPRYYASADIVVFPSLGGESFGIVLLEAMAAGRPVVLAASNPGYASVMQAAPGQMFQPGNVTALAGLLERYLTNKPANKSARQTALQWQAGYIPRFDHDVVGQELLEAYTRQLRKKQPA